MAGGAGVASLIWVIMTVGIDPLTCCRLLTLCHDTCPEAVGKFAVRARCRHLSSQGDSHDWQVVAEA